MKDRFFVPLAMALAAAMIGAALLPLALDRPGAPVSGKADGNAVLLDSEDIGETMGAKGFAVMALPGRKPDQEGVRMAATEAFGPGASGKGARLALAPDLRQRLAGRAMTVVILARSLPGQGPVDAVVGVADGGPVNWVRARVGVEFAPVPFDLGVQANPPQALAIWPGAGGGGQGIEVKEIRILTGAR